MHELHRRPQGVSLSELAKRFALSDRTIRRYAAAMCKGELADDRGRALVESVSIAGQPALRLADYATMPGPAKYDVLAAYFGLSLLRVLEGTAFGGSGKRLWDQLRRALPELAQTRLADAHRKFYSIPFAVKDYRRHDAVIDPIVRCLLENRRLRIGYGDPARRHDVDPYTLAEYRGGLYLVGRSHRGERIVTFAVERIRSAEPLPERFAYPARYDPATHTEGTFGILDGEETRVDLKILNEPTVGYLRARRVHPTQTFRKLADGTTMLSMRIRGTTELANWVLSHAPWIEVVRPRALREEIKERLEEAVARY
jgi:predicted DNA-binding transcriptional regulator YafY